MSRGGGAAPGLSFLRVSASSSGTGVGWGGGPTEDLPREPALVVLQGRVPLGRAESWAPLRLPRVYVSSTSVVLQRPSEEQGPSTGAGQGLGEVSRRAGLRDPEAAQAVRTSCVPGAADDFKP